MENIEKYLVYALAGVKVAEVVVNLTPNQTDNKILGYVQTLFKFFALKVPNIDKVEVKK